ncbi:MAG: hypothetical protein CL610_14060 [Anaerolineaceae bacterium]|nr:hypothetical protein [Anaerolineaceae bacterium]
MLPKMLACLIILLLWTMPLAAQNDTPLSEPINYDEPVADTLTARAFWDWWFIQASAGDEIVAEMTGEDGLEPLLGILDSGGELLARSPDGAPDGTVTLEYTVTTAGEYTIVATRTGNENGTSTGPYSLLVRRANMVPVRVNPYQEVIFRCQDYEAANALTVQFAEDVDQASYYLISVYGLDGFEPVIRVEFGSVDLTDCARDSQGMGGNVYALPGQEPITLTENYEASSAQLFISSAAPVGTVTLTVGSANGEPGRYIAVIDGFYTAADDRDTIRISQGPLAATAPLTLYMVADTATRLDPTISLPEDIEDSAICDDAARRGCEGVPSPDGLEIYLNELDRHIKADRFDAGLVLPPNTPDLRYVELGSFNDNTSGHYALVVLGELPLRE